MYWWMDEDDDQDEFDVLSDEEIYLIARKINSSNLTDRFFDIVQEQKQLFEKKMQDPSFEAKQIQKQIDDAVKLVEKLSKQCDLVAGLKGIVDHYLAKKKKDSYKAYSDLQLDMDNIDRSIDYYERNNLQSDPQFAKLKKQRTVFETLAKMKTVADVERYADKYDQKFSKAQKNFDETNNKIAELKRQKIQAEQKTMSAKNLKEIEEQTGALDSTKKSYVLDFCKFARVYPNDVFVQDMKTMINSAYFYVDDYKMPFDILDNRNFDYVVKQIASGKLKNLCKKNKDTDEGR